MTKIPNLYIYTYIYNGYVKITHLCIYVDIFKTFLHNKNPHRESQNRNLQLRDNMRTYMTDIEFIY